MTRDDALRVVNVALVADGGCYVCAGSCMQTARHMWPGFDWAGLAEFTPEEWPGSEYDIEDARQLLKGERDD